MKDEFNETAGRKYVAKLVDRAVCEKAFVAGVTSATWRTQDELVEDLEKAGYWDEPLSPADKRRHFREMVLHLWEQYGHEGSGGELRVLASRLAGTDEGGLRRVYKLAACLTPEDAEQLVDGHADLGAYYGVRLGELDRPDVSVAEHFFAELTEETRQKVAPRLDKEGWLWAIHFGLKLHRGVEELLLEFARENEAGHIVTSESATEHMERGMDAVWERLAAEVSEQNGVKLDEARAFVGQPGLLLPANLFWHAYRDTRDDSYGWTLDEYLQFVLDEPLARDNPYT
jgi:hypothetical protein